ncbi:unnamed protein product [Phyllotreta striolata]|uniref:Uncharacterized protein n=1 Tax=Phyllotreta striolata TaxID=444603 RepID=A0A9N9XK67_PHYSR|nr:unnamed protein product [Phyllotreta striolata]
MDTKILLAINLCITVLPCYCAVTTILPNGDILEIERLGSPSYGNLPRFPQNNRQPVTIEVIVPERQNQNYHNYYNYNQQFMQNRPNVYNPYWNQFNRPQARPQPQPKPQRYPQYGKPQNEFQIGDKHYIVNKQHANNPNIEVYTVDLVNPVTNMGKNDDEKINGKYEDEENNNNNADNNEDNKKDKIDHYIDNFPVVLLNENEIRR